MAYQLIQHTFIKRKYMTWLVCSSCGLLNLNNRFTKWCIKKGCLHEEHTDFERMRKQGK